jgi:hypothetical protein
MFVREGGESGSAAIMSSAEAELESSLCLLAPHGLGHVYQPSAAPELQENGNYSVSIHEGIILVSVQNLAHTSASSWPNSLQGPPLIHIPQNSPLRTLQTSSTIRTRTPCSPRCCRQPASSTSPWHGSTRSTGWSDTFGLAQCTTWWVKLGTCWTSRGDRGILKAERARPLADLWISALPPPPQSPQSGFFFCSHPQQTLNPFNSLFNALDQSNRSGSLNALGNMYVADSSVDAQCSSGMRVAPGLVPGLAMVVGAGLRWVL